MRSPRLRGVVLALGLALAPAARLLAQDSLPPKPAAPVPTAPVVADSADTARAAPLGARPVSPGGALWRSMLVPGWGQAKLGRKVPAIIFLGVEGLTLGMAFKANAEYQYLRDADIQNSAGKSLEREDWLVLLGVNHLLAGVEAYVSAHLWDFPGDVAVAPAPGGGVYAGLSVPVRVR